jgi:hypothetical protein
VTIGHSQT